MSKRWLITGGARGLGRAFAEAALGRGDRVAASARRMDDLKTLKDRHGDQFIPVTFDVTDRRAVGVGVQIALEQLGGIDIVVNNAGYGHVGAFEEVTDAELRRQLDVNLFGALRVTQAVLPTMRDQGSGHIIQISSIGGVVAFPNLSAYHASKWALEGMSESLAVEVRKFGISVTLVEPGAFATDSEGPSSTRSEPNPAYDSLRAARSAPYGGQNPDDPHLAGQAMLRIVDAESPPLRALLGPTATDLAYRMHERRLNTWKEWDSLSRFMF
ncbi:SDR family NAD(P)-dependent oxidoreductase [Rhodococcus pseudokoreensis]|uniref:SDR family NAD(P)-dependent oxidoreductase n=1 Tax=Rhodococcus pseudokoreensis TaxID=2811421 RepID=A0A974ZW04_9NOCA|nr:SDR family NAD(P)-dependent oxidoreductase [Rhodococcus pseudokoreensis]QSE92096.1 SDR family NAD(P)-dependent oxidoreductase [Rhodococcus pseudokoreensis]